MATALVYTGKKAIHTAGVDVGPNFVHFDLVILLRLMTIWLPIC